MTTIEFELPARLEATEPPEPRDEVRLLVASKHDGVIEHRRFVDLPDLLTAGDVLVVNTSATLAAALDGHIRHDAGSERAELHLSTRLPGDLWIVELRHPPKSPAKSPPKSTPTSTPTSTPKSPSEREAAHTDGAASTPWLDAETGTVVHLAGGGTATLVAPTAPTAPAGENTGTRLWFCVLALPEPLLAYLARCGRPIRYGYIARDWPIAAYQTVFADEPGSAEMPSAARPFSASLVTRLVGRGVAFAPFVLHCGVSSLEAHEPPFAEWFRVGLESADTVNRARAAGHRVIAVGTTAVRALETVVDARGIVHPGEGWTELVVTPERGVRAVDGLITGWHEPQASHLAMLEAIAGPALLGASYRAALEEGYLWHEFGDSHLILP